MRCDAMRYTMRERNKRPKKQQVGCMRMWEFNFSTIVGQQMVRASYELVFFPANPWSARMFAPDALLASLTSREIQLGFEVARKVQR